MEQCEIDRIKKDNQDRINNILYNDFVNRFPERLRSKTLKEFKNIPEWVNEYLKNPCSLFLSGTSGSGKTHLAVALLKEIAKTNIYCSFVSASDMFYEFRNDMKSEGSEHNIIKYTKNNFIVIDDIGAEKTTDFVKEIFYLIVDRQYRNMKHIILTTNLTQEEFTKNYDYRILSRFYEMGIVKTLAGKDYRLKK